MPAVLGRVLELNLNIGFDLVAPAKTRKRRRSRRSLWLAVQHARFAPAQGTERAMEPQKDVQTVTTDGTSTQPRIDGVIIRHRAPIEDERGEVVEVYRPEWGVHPDPLVYVYQVSVRPGKIKGWVVHKSQDDRIFVSRGTMLWALYDDREGSSTHGLLNVFTLSERNRALLVVPKGVFHAVQNVGDCEAMFINMPTRPYDHENPDKLRLPVKNDLIPFDFS